MARLISEGMSPGTAQQVVESIPCFIKRDVPRSVAEQYASVFMRAGALAHVRPSGEDELDPNALAESASGEWQRAKLAAGSRTDHEPPSAADTATRVAVEKLMGPVAEPPPLRLPGVDVEAEAGADGDAEADAEAEAEAEAEAGAEAEKKDGYHQAYKLITPPPPEPYLKRKLPMIISGVVVLLIASYIYGCVDVMRSSVRFRRERSTLNMKLENMNARGKTVTRADVVSAVQGIGAKAGLSIDDDEVEIEAVRIGQLRGPLGCTIQNPDALADLPPEERNAIFQAARTCGVPTWVLKVTINNEARWGLFSRTIETNWYARVNHYLDE